MSICTCKNCGNRFEGKYCSNCKQPAETHRITWHELAHQLVHALFHTDKGFLYTIKELTLRPGYTIRNHINGKRAYHFNPLMYLVLTGGVASLLFASLHVQLPIKEIDLEKIERYSGTLAHKYFALVGLIFIILLTATDYFFYYRKKFILPELIISNTYQAGQIMVFTIVLFPLLIFQNYILQRFGIAFESRLLLKAIVLAFLFFTRFQLYEAKGDYLLIAKIVLQLTLVFVLYNYVIAGVLIYWQR